MLQSHLQKINSTSSNEKILLTDVFDTIPGGISFTLDMSCHEIYHNKTAAKLLRIWEGEGEFLSQSMLILPTLKMYRNGKELDPEEMPIQRSVWQGEEITGEVLECKWSDGVKRTVIWSSSPIRSETSRVIIGAIATSEDISYRIKIVEELRKHSEHLEELISRQALGNQISNDILQTSKNILQASYDTLQTSKETLQREMPLRLNFEKELARLERLNLLGQMAAGIAHEVRNPMTTVRGFLQLLGSRQEYVKEKPSFDLMIEELDRSNAIMTEFLTLAKTKISTEFDLIKIDINSLISNLYPLLMSDAINLNQNLIFEEGRIEELYLNPKEINQLIINLVQNGFEANSPNKNVTIKTYSQDDLVVLSIKDEGSGIAPEILEKLGTPFITTKDTGTGIGLSVCYGIATRHNAEIKVATGSWGTNFTIQFKRPDFALIKTI